MLRHPTSLDQFTLKEQAGLSVISLLGMNSSYPDYTEMVEEIRAYNLKLSEGSLSETYEHKVYEQLASILKNLQEGSVDYPRVLSETRQWLERQKRKIKYERELKQLLFKEKHKPKGLGGVPASFPKRATEVLQQGDAMLLKGSRLRGDPHMLLPYIKGNRSAIVDVDPPSERLKQYTRKKLIAIERATANVVSQKKASRIIYKAQPYRIKQDPSEPDQQPDTTIPPDSIEVDRLDEGKAPVENLADSPALGQMGMIGQEGQQEPEEEQEVEDRLAPNTKPYVKAAEQEQPAPVPQETAFTQHQEARTSSMKAMNQRYLKMLNSQYRNGSEEKDAQQHFYKWAREKARAAKEVSRKKQVRVIKAYNQKYGKKAQQKSKQPLTDLSSVVLPSLNAHREKQTNVEFESSIYSTQLIRHKRRLEKIHRRQDNPEEEDEQMAISPAKLQSLSVVEQRKYRSLGSILDQFSPQKEQQRQLDEVHKIKASLAKYGNTSLTVKQLADALVVPLIRQNPEAVQPSKILPSNPYFVVPTSKKKKPRK